MDRTVRRAFVASRPGATIGMNDTIDRWSKSAPRRASKGRNRP